MVEVAQVDPREAMCEACVNQPVELGSVQSLDDDPSLNHNSGDLRGKCSDRLRDDAQARRIRPSSDRRRA